MRSTPGGDAPAPAVAAQEPPPGPGLHTLLQGKKPEKPESAPRECRVQPAAPAPASDHIWAGLRVLLLAADALLVLLALSLVSKSAGQASGLDLALGISALAVGAALGGLACLRNPFASVETRSASSAKAPIEPRPEAEPAEVEDAPPESRADRVPGHFQPHYVACK